MIPIQDNTPRRCPPLMTWAIIAVNVIVFLFEIRLPKGELEAFFLTYGLVPSHLAHDLDFSDGLSLLSTMFIHGGWLHIIFNMWALWIFGDNVEDEMGPGRYLAFYLIGGIVASIIFLMSNPSSTMPVIGASGAISAVMGAYFILFPKARIIILVPIFFFPFFFEVPAVFFLAFWFFEQVFGGALSLSAPHYSGWIAWWAHVGGFIFGFITCKLFLYHKKPGQCLRFRDELRPWGMLKAHDRH